jgi:hypothetical protein
MSARKHSESWLELSSKFGVDECHLLLDQLHGMSIKCGQQQLTRSEAQFPPASTLHHGWSCLLQTAAQHQFSSHMQALPPSVHLLMLTVQLAHL